MKLNTHNLSHDILWTCKMGELKPTCVLEVLPNDRITYVNKSFVRFSPMVAPVMSIVKNYSHTWYVPTWLLWDEFEDFITGNKPDLRVPKVKFHKNCAVGTLWDAFGLPCQTNGATVPTDFEVNALLFKAFWFIYDVYYRDEDLQPDLAYDKMEPLIDKWIAETASDDDIGKIVNIPLVAWRKDIYTTARPWKQKGGEVTIPLDIASDGNPLKLTSIGDASSGFLQANTLLNTVQYRAESGSLDSWTDLKYGAGLTGAGLSINELALASALARLKYRDGRRGSRYAELLNRMGANSADARLFIPQFLGGGSDVMKISEVVQTSESTDTSSLGDLGGHGIGWNTSKVVKRAYNEHGYQITLGFFRPEPVYDNSTDRLWLQDIREDFFFKELENIGTQEIMTRELFPNAPKDEIFGYNDAYYQYRQMTSKVTGEFRELDKHWHLARIFGNKPVLNASFIECEPSNRIFADLINDTLKVQTQHFIKAKRMVAKTARLKI